MISLTNKTGLNLSSESLIGIFTIAVMCVFVLVSFYLPFNLIFYLVCFAAAGLLILKCPEAGVYTVIFCTIVFERWFTLQPLEWGGEIIKLYPLDVILGLTLLSLIFRSAVSKQFRFGDKNLGGAIWIWVAVFAANFVRVWFQKDASPDLAFSTFKNFALYFVVYLLVINLIRTPAQFKRLLNFLMAAGVFLLYFVIYGWITGQGLWSEFVPLSTPGDRLLGGPHSFYATLMIILLFSLISWSRKWAAREYLYIFLLLIFIAGLLGSLQRHLWLGLILGLGLLLYFYPTVERRKFFRLGALILVIFMILVLTSFWFYSWQASNFLTDSSVVHSLKFRLFSFFTAGSSDSSAIWRLASWQEAAAQFNSAWLWGVGLGQKLLFQIGELKYDIEIRDLHNDFIGLALQLGLAGILAAVYLFYKIVKMFSQKYRQLSSAYRPYFLVWFVLALVFLWSANFGTYFDINLLAIFFWLFLGGMVVSGELGGEI